MPTSLQSRLGDLALAFSESVLEAIRGASLQELFDHPGVRKAPVGAPPAAAAPASGSRRRGPGRLSRRTATDIERVIAEIVGLLGHHSAGLRAEQIRQQLGLMAKELPRPLKEALDSGRLGKAGQKRATTYFLAGPLAPARKASAGRRRSASAPEAGDKGVKVSKPAGSVAGARSKAKRRGPKRAKRTGARKAKR